MKKTTSLLLTTLLASSTLGANFNVRDRILSQKVFIDNYQSVFGKIEYAQREKFLEAVTSLKRKKKKHVIRLLKEIDQMFPDKIARPIIHWRSVNKNKEKLSDVLFYYMSYKAFTLRDHIDNPLTQGPSKKVALKLLKKLLSSEEVDSNSISNHFVRLRRDANLMASPKSDEDFVAALKSNALMSTNLQKEVPGISPYSLTALGFIPGSKSEIISENDTKLSRIEWFNERVIFSGGKLDFDAPYVKMPTKDDPSGHVVFKYDPIYKRIREMIDRADNTIFIDIFLFGGTLGATLSEYLLDETIKKVQANPDFKVMILHDYATNYNMVEEMLPIFQYIQKRRAENPSLKKSVSLLQANIQRHPPGVPFNLTEIIPKTPESFSYFEGGNTYYESKIDHSKVLVVDGNYDDAEAYFGSKNWTDHSGGYYFDDVVYLTGPAAAIVQASYYRDIDAALTEDKFEMSRMYYKELGLDNKKYLPRKKELLAQFEITKDVYNFEGGSTVRIAEADVDGTIKNVRNILIDMIKNAKDHIYMEQLFLYDSYVVDALIKKKAQDPEVKINLVIDHNGNFGFNGLPNTIYVKDLIDAGIHVRARTTDPHGITAQFPDGTEKVYHQENHRKITSVDGKVVLGGSFNINPDTLQGSFREYGAQVFDKKEVASFEARFEADWKNPKKMEKLDIENFKANVLGKLFDKKSSALINDIAGMVYRVKDFLEKRF